MIKIYLKYNFNDVSVYLLFEIFRFFKDFSLLFIKFNSKLFKFSNSLISCNKSPKS